MNGYGSHTFKLVNDKNEVNYCKFHFKVSKSLASKHFKFLFKFRINRLIKVLRIYQLHALLNYLAKTQTIQFKIYIMLLLMVIFHLGHYTFR